MLALSIDVLGSYQSGVLAESAAEIVAFHAATQRTFVINAQAGSVDVLDASDPTAPTKITTLSLSGLAVAGGGTTPADVVANSVAVRADGLVVVAVEAPTKTDPGWLAFFDATALAKPLGAVSLGSSGADAMHPGANGAQPDSVVLSPDGTYAVVANEGEPEEDYSVDPEGSVAVVALPATLTAPAASAVKQANFHAWEDAANGGTKNRPAGVRVYGGIEGGAYPVSEVMEPEYVAVTGGKAYVTVQEANAIAVVDLATAEITDLLALAPKDLSLAANAIDPSDKDGKAELRTLPKGIYGLALPDSISTFTGADGKTYLVTANEGDSRDWEGFSEEVRIKDLGKDGLPPLCEDSTILAGTTWKDLKKDENLGRLKITTTEGLSADGSCYEELYTYGTRSFSVWTTDGTLVFDSGSDFEEIVAATDGVAFNASNESNDADDRSDDKGPEPEAVTVGTIDGRTYAFVGLERVSGVMVYDITDPAQASFVTYVNNRDFTPEFNVEDGPTTGWQEMGDIGPESIVFVAAADAPNGEPMLVIGNEVSGTTSYYRVRSQVQTLQLLGFNDFHGRLVANGTEAGAAVMAGAIDALETANPATVVLSAGDNIGASTFVSFSQDDAPTLDVLNAMGVDASAVGNHEFDQGVKDLTDRVIPASDFPFLGANVYGADGKALLNQNTVIDVQGIRVGVIGVVTPQTATLVSPAGIQGVTFGPMLEAVTREATELTDGDTTNGEADVIVLLAHDGGTTGDCAALTEGNSDFATLLRGLPASVDAVFSGHTHQTYNCAVTIAGREFPLPVVQTGQYATNLGSIELDYDRTTGAVTAAASKLIALAPNKVPAFPASGAVTQIVADAVAEADKIGKQTVGSITGPITRAKAADGSEDRGAESSLGNLLADTYLWAASDANPDYSGPVAQIGMINPGGLRADLLGNADGTVTYEQVAAVQPFANTLVVVDLTGAQLRAVLNEQWQPEGSSRPYLHLGISGGLKVAVDETRPAGDRVTAVWLNDKPVADTDTVSVVTNSFLASGGDNFTTFAKGANATDTGWVDLAASLAYFEAHPSVAPAETGRQREVNGAWGSLTVSAPSVVIGGTVDVTVKGLNPGDIATVTLHSDPVVLGTITADATGAGTLKVTIPAGTAVGEHSLTISPNHPALAEMSVPLTVTAPPAGGDDTTKPAVPGQKPMPSTGLGGMWAIGGAVLASLAAGAGLLFVRRRSLNQ